MYVCMYVTKCMMWYPLMFPSFVENIHRPSFATHNQCTVDLFQGDEYASWMAGCRMVMKGRALARSGYEQELSSIKAFVAMQNKADPGSSSASADSVSISCTVYIVHNVHVLVYTYKYMYVCTRDV